MSNKKPIDQVPVLYVRGTHYQVGFAIGKSFATLTQEFFQDWTFVKETVIPVFNSTRGKKIYEETLALCTRRFPQYVEELKGISDGASVPFHVCFLLHNLGVVQLAQNKDKDAKDKDSSQLGCTGVISNVEKLILAHNEDAPVETINRFFIVSAQIIDENGAVIEDFASLTYPGFLPGYTMGYNKHGFIYCVNTICPEEVYEAGTPILFLARALLGAKNKEEVLSILKDSGVGTSDGISLNFVSAKEKGGPVAGNIEVAPSTEGQESEINVHWVTKGSSYVHCNRYLRLKKAEVKSYSSTHRHAAISKLPSPNTLKDVKIILSDQSDFDFPVYRVGPREDPLRSSPDGQDSAATVATGIFDVEEKTWAIYTKPLATSEPVVVLPMNF